MAAPTAKRLQDKIAVVTGASSGIGRAIAIAYATHGAKLVIGDRSEKSTNPAEADKSTSEVINGSGGQCVFHEVDVTDSKSVDSLVAFAVKTHGRLDIMVNNAGIALEATNPQPIWLTKNEIWSKTLDVNANGVFYGTRAASAQMITQEPHENGDRGWIVNLASILGLIAAPDSTAYVASKHLVMGITKAAALDCAAKRIHVNAICPGFVDSSLTTALIGEENDHRALIQSLHPFRGIGKPEDVSAVAVMLASDDARWMTGTGVTTDGGYSIQ